MELTAFESSLDSNELRLLRSILDDGRIIALPSFPPPVKPMDVDDLQVFTAASRETKGVVRTVTPSARSPKVGKTCADFGSNTGIADDSLRLQFVQSRSPSRLIQNQHSRHATCARR